MTGERARNLIDRLYRGSGFAFCENEQAAIGFALSPEDFAQFCSLAGKNGYIVYDLLQLLIREYIEAQRSPVNEEEPDKDESPECYQDVDDLFRLYAEIGQEVDDLRDEVRFIRRALSCRRC